MGLFNLLFGKPQQSKVDLLALNRDLEILNDCARLIESTVNPEVFFSRYDLYMEKLSILSSAQERNLIKVSGDNISKKYSEMNTEKKKIETINNFISRMWNNTCENAEKLKTDKGKQNRYQKFFDTMQTYEHRMPLQSVQYYRSMSIKSHVPTIDRRTIPAEKIDQMQRIEASDNYKNMIYAKYYFDYPEKPFISKDREENTNWLDQEGMFPEQSIIPKFMMTRFSDGLLPGHVYMLYWIDKIHRKRIPVYFEYEFGIDFEKEKLFLQEKKYLDSDGQLTEKGRQAILNHYDVIANKK